MSMLFSMVGVTPDQAAALRASPSLANDLAVVAQNDAQETSRRDILDQLPAERRKDAEVRFQALQASPLFQEARNQRAQAHARLASLDPFEPALALDKSWHILHYVFTGNIGPVGSPGDALMTGDDLGGDMGYGPPRLHGPEDTRKFADFLEALDPDKLQARLNYRAMNEIGVYSMPMGPGSEAEFESGIRREVASYFPRLRDYVVQMAEKKNGLLMWLT